LNRSSIKISSFRDSLTQRRAEILCCIILLLMGANMVSVIARKSLTNDELVHIPSGYQYLTTGNFSLNPEHPPLVKMWAAAPLLFLRPNVNTLTAPADQNFATLTVDTSIDFWQANKQRFQAISFWARVPMILLTLALGALIFIFGRQLFGRRAAVIAVALFSLEPTMLAHGRIVHTDVPAAFGYLLFFFALYGYGRAPTFSRAVWFGVATGAALLTKFSLAILAPIFVGALIYGGWKALRHGSTRRRAIAQTVIASLVVLVVLNAAYYFQHPPLARSEIDFISGAATKPVNAQRIIATVNLLSKILPTEYLFGIYTIYVHNHFGHPTSLLGHYSNFGWWYYFPVTFALKTTLPFLLLAVAALLWAIWAGLFRKEREVILLIAPVAIYMVMSMSGNINIGVRHIAPVFPFLFLLGGTFLDRFLNCARARAAAVFVVVLLGWMLVDAVRAYPDYLSYTSPLTLGKPGWQLLNDSNVEWGEDIGELAAYLHARGETQLVGAVSGGWVPEMYTIKLQDFAPPDLQSSSTRYVAIGAGFLNGATVPAGLRDANNAEISEEQRRNYFDKYRTLKPEKVFGHSIYLYRARE
jgi:hypothetical protein